MQGIAAFEGDVAARHRDGDHEGAGLDAIRNDCRFNGMQPVNPHDRDDIRARPEDLCPHAVEDLGQIDHLRLPGRIVQHRRPFGQTGRHHDVFRSRHRGKVKENLGSPEPFRAGLHIAFPEMHVRAHILQRFDMKVYGPGADGAASRERHTGRSHPRDKRPQHENGRPHGPDQIIGGLAMGNPARVHPDGAFAFDVHAETVQEFFDRADVHEIGNVVIGIAAFGEQGGTQDRQRRILCAADGYLAVKPPAAFDDHFIHDCRFLFAAATRSRPA
jgi:hypothetical protein